MQPPWSMLLDSASLGRALIGDTQPGPPLWPQYSCLLAVPQQGRPWQCRQWGADPRKSCSGGSELATDWTCRFHSLWHLQEGPRLDVGWAAQRSSARAWLLCCPEPWAPITLPFQERPRYSCEQRGCPEPAQGLTGCS